MLYEINTIYHRKHTMYCDDCKPVQSSLIHVQIAIGGKMIVKFELDIRISARVRQIE